MASGEARKDTALSACLAGRQPVMRILYFGMMGALSRTPLEQLLADGQEIVAVFLPAERLPGHHAVDPLAVALQRSAFALTLAPAARTIVHIAQERGIPVYGLRQPAAQATRALIGRRQPDSVLLRAKPCRRASLHG